MKKLVYILLAFILLQSFKNVDNQEPKIKIFNLPGGVQIKMIWVKSGSFIMGSPIDEVGRSFEREEQHKVTISKGFWLAETEFTQDQWKKVMGNNPSFHKGGNLPVDQVSYVDIQKFLEKVNGKNGKFRLPTEAEWEYACRAGSSKAYSSDNIDEMVWHRGNSGRKSHPVAQKKANAWGFYDMQGNILEWCSDWLEENNTDNNIDPKGSKKGMYRVQRGGQFTGRTRHTRAADRQRALPDKRDFYVGFRLAYSN